MPTPFPGMDPYLERADIWPNVHSSLIVAIRDYLVPILRPKYYVAVEERVVHSGPEDLSFSLRPDVMTALSPRVLRESAVAYYAGPGRLLTVQVPPYDQTPETWLEIRTVEKNPAKASRVVTVLELLSPTNKRPGRGRNEYTEKRLQLLNTRTHLVEIDLLRSGEPMDMIGLTEHSDYRILVSRSQRRPDADLYIFNVSDPIPAIPLPLLPEDNEPSLNLNQLLHDLYDRAGFDLRIDYSVPPEPPLRQESR